MQKIRLKGLYIRKFSQKHDHTGHFWPTQAPVRKLFKTATHYHMTSNNHHYLCQIFKNAPKIQHFSFEGDFSEYLLRNLSHYLTNLPKKTLSIKLLAISITPVNESEIYKIPMALRYLPYLQYFQKNFVFERNTTEVPKELEFYDFYTRRLRNLKNLICLHHTEEQKGLHEALKGEEQEQYVRITGLGMYLIPTNFEMANVFDNLYQPEDSVHLDSLENYKANSILEQTLERQKSGIISDDNEEDSTAPENNENNIVIESDGSQETDQDKSDSDIAITNSILYNKLKLAIEASAREEITTCYNFRVFPNLTKLSLNIQNVLYPLGTFVIDAFQALNNLKDLKIRLSSRPIGTVYIFKGLLELPSLDSFSLDLEFLKGEDWSLLGEFLRYQKDLQAFSLRVQDRRGNRERYLQQNEHLENTLRALEGNLALKSLNIRSCFWSLEALSRGLRPLTMTNQLQSFEFEGSDDIVTSSHTNLERVGGICEFIKKHKETLREVVIMLPCEIKPSIVGHVMEAVSEVKELRKFMLHMNCNFFNGASEIREYFEDTIQEGIAPEKRKKILKLKNWNPSIAKNLKKLQRLQEVGVFFDVLEKESQNQGKWFLDLVRALPEIKSLRRFSFNTYSCGMIKDIAKKLIAALKEMKNVREISASIHNIDAPSGTEISEIYEVVKMMNKKQATRCDLMF